MADPYATSRGYLVVGGTHGIGEATVRLLAQEITHTVVFCGRDKDAGTRLSNELSAGNTHFVPVDITVDESVDALFDALPGLLPHFDGAFNSAGVIGTDTILRGTRFHDSEEGHFDQVFAVNVKGMWRCLRHELRLMSAARGGSIVNCASVAGLRAADSLSVSYTASKHAVIGMTRALAAEYARDGVRVNAVCPGVIDTRMLGGLRDRLLVDLRRKNPGASVGSPAQVAEAVAFLLSERSSYVNGTALTVDAGGLHGAL
ncbi:NAD(P)-dependent dehydrogenase, short-chain alcohol dehydrogenase family [Actinacidiphila yanglinensis]|uniref:NAD(P)-dependent dehydrogenase, short-chain alcohol dehydrogenase family n=1 Tax=Actinacidiphila yanglinensis TaxID=310779 RepID=A0A1H6DGB7_9ACTN|nr:SDR family oxidoreductase [Actinacidiphila yanglinensis]SEG84517.1 NAD(P)-dependent dehydrogenase, short-chain alcohol dehydrogenase family [Actinacidiphila yanglinensis]